MNRNTILELRHLFKEWWLTLKEADFSFRKSAGGVDTIAVVDGTQYHGGMCDRFKGIVTLYAYSKAKGLNFRISYTHPFMLEDYLLPAEYDWTLKDGELCTSLWHSRVMYMRGEYPGRRIASLDTRKQVRFYGNRDCLGIINYTFGTDYKWGELFRELFRPVPVLEERLSQLHEEIGASYNAAVFRFQNMLGDFREYKCRPLETEGRKLLIDRCLEGLRDYLSAAGDGKKMLVTSDSITFLKEASKIDNVFVIPGSVVHIGGLGDYRPEHPFEVYMKSFLDFYMIAGADSVACIGTPEMYPSEFPMYAAKVYDIPFFRVKI